MLIKLKIGIVVFGFYCVISIIPSAFGLKSSSYLSSLEKERPPRPQKNSRYSAPYRISNPKSKNLVNRTPSNSQDVIDIYVNPNYSGYSDLNPLQLATNDAIRIVDPPKFFQEQKKLFKQNPLHQLSQSSAPVKKSKKPTLLPSFQQNEPPRNEHSQEEFHYKGPEYFPYQTIQQQKYADDRPVVEEKRQKVQRGKSERRKPEREKTERGKKEREKFERPQKPPLTYSGIQTPNSKSIRNQIQSFKEKQRLQFEDEDDEHPARPANSRKRHPSQRRNPRPQNDEEDRPLGYEIFRDTERRVKDALGIRETRPKSSSRGTDSSEIDSVPKEEKAPFVPYQMLASVRHTNRISHQPKPIDLSPRATSRLKTQQRHTVYSEQGFEDEEYDHGDEERHAHHGDKERHRYHKQTRRKRGTIRDKSEEVIENVKELPMVLTLTDSNGKNISGQALFDHISKLIGKSPKFIPSESEGSELDSVLLKPEDLGKIINRTNLFGKKAKKKFTKFPFKKIDPSVIPDQSAIKYAEKLGNFNESPYEKKETSADCEIVEPDFEQKGKKKKLGQLGDKLECMKGKFFGKDPLGNRFFKEPIINPPDSGKIKLNDPDPLKMQTYRSPFLELVYTDVMKTIKTSLVAEQEMNADHEDEIDQNGRGTELTEPNSQNTDTLENLLPIFNTVKFIPNVYMIRPDGKVYGIKIRQPTDNQKPYESKDKIVKTLVKVTKKPDSGRKIEKIQRPTKIRMPAIKLKSTEPRKLITESSSIKKPIYYKPTNRQPAPVTEDVEE